MQSLLPGMAACALSFAGCLLITSSKTLSSFGNTAPAEDRWHQEATPGLGGIPLFLAFALVAMVSSLSSTLSLIIIVTAVPLVVAGVWDDLRPISPRWKLVSQIFASMLLLVLLLFTFRDLPQTGASLFASFLFYAMTVFWLVAIINATNLLDNMDGLSAGCSLVAVVTIAIIASTNPQLFELSSLFIVLAGALLGFLLLNRNPAKLFMGDAGALWLGLVVASGSILVMSVNSLPAYSSGSIYSLSNWSPADWLLPLAICAVPITDTSMVMITRKLRGQAVSQGGRDHLSHRLVSLGLTERRAVAILWFISIVFSLLALLIHFYEVKVWVAPVIVCVLLLVALVIWLVRATSSSLVTS